MSMFSDLVEEVMEIFMDDFTVYGSSFEQCLNNLEIVLQRCKDKQLALNWEKCHFMVTEGIVLGHKISAIGLEVDQSKISIIKTLAPPTTVKGIRSFLGHAGFYRRFIKDFSRIADHYEDYWRRTQGLILMIPARLPLKKSKADWFKHLSWLHQNGIRDSK